MKFLPETVTQTRLNLNSNSTLTLLDLYLYISWLIHLPQWVWKKLPRKSRCQKPQIRHTRVAFNREKKFSLYPPKSSSSFDELCSPDKSCELSREWASEAILLQWATNPWTKQIFSQETGRCNNSYESQSFVKICAQNVTTRWLYRVETNSTGVTFKLVQCACPEWLNRLPI